VQYYRDLINHPNLLNIFYKNQRFVLVDSHLYKLQPDRTMKHIPQPNPNLRFLNKLVLDTANSVPVTLMRRFHGGGNFFPSMADPKSLMIELKVVGSSISMSQLRLLKFRGLRGHSPDRGEDWSLGITEMEFVLCAIVRTTSGSAEYVRVYLGGNRELRTSQTGD
jgi:hypothetical protein